MAATMVDMYVPLFGQRLRRAGAGDRGLPGGTVGGWTVGEIASASVTNIRATVRLVAAAPW